jgi:hypothetical protein
MKVRLDEFRLTLYFDRRGPGRVRVKNREPRTWTKLVRVTPEVNDPAAWKVQLAGVLRKNRTAHHYYAVAVVTRSDGTEGFRTFIPYSPV